MGEPGSALVVAEKRPQRPGGCVGIFFQLVDWNKRLTQKKLFSKKLLTHSRLMRAVKNFNKGDKLPGAKLRLIADENRGGFPKRADAGSFSSSSYNAKHSKMQTPNLVARLMGLESIPAASRDKPSQTELANEICDDLGKNMCQSSDFCYDGHVSPEEGQQVLESRPQKLQRTGFFQSAPVAKMGVEALQFKSVLSRSRKRQMKLPTPVKSPRAFLGKRATRLMGAATRILEPSVEASNRARRLLSYPAVPSSRIENCSINGVPSTSYRGVGNRCNSCGHFVGAEFNSNVEEQVFEISPSNWDFGCSLDGSRFKSHILPRENEKKEGRITLRDHVTAADMPTVQVEKNGHCGSRSMVDEGINYDYNDMGSSRSTLLDYSSCKAKNNQKQNPMETRTDLRSHRNFGREIHRRDLSSPNRHSGIKDYIAMNRNLAGQTRTRLHEKFGENCKYYEKTSGSKMKDTSLRSDDRRPLSRTQFRGAQLPVDSNLVRGENGFNEIKRYANITGSNEIRKKPDSGSHGASGTDDSVPFFFNSSDRSNDRLGLSRETINKADVTGYRRVFSDAKGRSRQAKKHGVDALGILLENKLRELAHLETNGPEKGVGPGGQTMAGILEDLISALSLKFPDEENEYEMESSQGYDSPKSCSSKMQIQEGLLRKKQPSSMSALAFDFENPSPTSIFEACFSNDSNCSQSPDSGSGKSTHQFSSSLQGQVRQRSPPETDIVDSGNPRQLWVCEKKSSETLKRRDGTDHCSDDCPETFITDEDIFNVDFLFGKESSLADPKFMSKIQALSEAMEAKNPSGAFAISDAMGNNSKRFFIDFMMEYMIERPSCLYYPHKCGLSNLPFTLSKQQLMMEVYREISNCMNLAGMTPDEIVEWELKNSSRAGKEYDSETTEISRDIASVVFQILLDELMVDLWYRSP